MADYRSVNDFDPENRQIESSYIGRTFPNVKLTKGASLYKAEIYKEDCDEFYLALESVNPGVDKVQARIPFGNCDTIFFVLTEADLLVLKLKTDVKIELQKKPKYKSATGELMIFRKMV